LCREPASEKWTKLQRDFKPMEMKIRSKYKDLLQQECNKLRRPDLKPGVASDLAESVPVVVFYPRLFAALAHAASLCVSTASACVWGGGGGAISTDAGGALAWLGELRRSSAD
jgi:hypothetical protein